MSPSQDSESRARRLARAELFRFDLYLKSINVSTVLVGGWAVYSYNPYLESIDIDLIVKDEEMAKAKAIAVDNCGWIPREELANGTFSRYVKLTENGKEILLDLLSPNFANIFHEDREKRLPYELCMDSSWSSRTYINNIVVNVPSKELLLLYKLKAYRDRVYRLGERVAAEEEMRLQTKITKDLSDSISLIDPNYGALDLTKLHSLIDEFDLYFLAETVANIPSQNEAIQQYRHSSTRHVAEWVKKTLEGFRKQPNK